MYKQVILSKLLDYLKLKKIPFKKGGVITFECPFCKKPSSATILPNTHKINCFVCNPKTNIGHYFTLVDIAKKVDNLKGSDDEILQYLKDLLKIKVLTKTDEITIEDILLKYKEWNFDLIPVTACGKVPIEGKWNEKSHKDIDEWNRWIKDGLNVGVKTGRMSNLLVIDLDALTKKEKDEIRNKTASKKRIEELKEKRKVNLKTVYDEIKTVMGEPLIQESLGGEHLFYRYDEDIPKTSITIKDTHIDIEAEGGYILLYPSRVKDDNFRRFTNIKDISDIPILPKELKKYLVSKMDKFPKKTYSEKIIEDIATEDFKINPEDFKLKNNNLEGVCNSSFIKLGGILRKQLNSKMTSFVLHTLNKHMLEDPMDSKAITGMVRELDRYMDFDEQELAHKVLEYLKSVEEANRTEIAMAVVNTNRGEEKKRVDIALQYLVKEGLVLKHGRSYAIMKKVEWKENLIETGTPIDFDMPYFYDVANFNYGDLILIGSKHAKGKTHISMNIVKELVKQGLHPYYISLETGSRFAKIALQLGLKEGDFSWTFCADPTQIELEPNSVTVIDWLMIPDKAKTDLVFKHLVEQLYKTNGILIVFQQLKSTAGQENRWFAENMVNQFPALSARYLYDTEDSGEFGKFQIDKMREPKVRTKSYEICCRYNWETKELKRVDEWQKEEEKKNGKS